MFIYNHCTSMGNSCFNEKISIDKREEYIKKYKLKSKGDVKEYWVNNVCIMDINGKKTYNYIKDISINYVNNILVQEIASINCIPFNFYTVDIQEEYILYQTIKDGIDILVKEYDEYLTLEYRSESMESFYTL